MMPGTNLSTNTLFHFTRSLAGLVGILQSGLRPAYSLEDLSALSGDISNRENTLAIPMTCFCDIPLSQAREHMSLYGHYGIGMSKSWGIGLGVCPVLYALSSSPSAVAIREILMAATKPEGDSPNGDHDDLWTHVERVLCFIKPYAGVSPISGEEVRFYDEREWRYVAREPDGSVRWLLPKDLAQWARTQSLSPPFFHGTPLALPVSEVRYILVRDDVEILPVMNVLQAIGGSVLTMDEVRLLQSRIFSAAQVAEDF